MEPLCKPARSSGQPAESASNQQRAPHAWAIWGALITIYVVWGSTYLAIRFAVESLPPFTMAGVRFLFAGAVMYAWRRTRGDAAPTRRGWGSAAIVGLLLLAGGNGAVVWAEQRIASSIASLLVATVPLWMVLLDALRPGGRRVEWWTGAGVVVGFAGVAVLIGPAWSGGSAGRVDPIGAVVVIVGMLFWSTGSLYSREAPLPASPLLATSVEMMAGGAGLLILGALTGEWGRLDLGTVATRSLLAMGYLIVFGSWVAFTAYTWLLRVAPTSLVATYAYVNPLVAIALGHVLAAEPLTARILVAAAVIVGSVALITATQGASHASKKARAELVPAEEA